MAVDVTNINEAMKKELTSDSCQEKTGLPRQLNTITLWRRNPSTGKSAQNHILKRPFFITFLATTASQLN